MEAKTNARTLYHDRKANSAKYMSTMNIQDDENALQPTSEPWLRFGGKAPPFFLNIRHQMQPNEWRRSPVLRYPRSHYVTRAVTHFESCESVSRDNLGHLLTVAFCLTAVSHAWPPCPTDMQSLHLTKHATNPQRP